jgi:hypothetical protein
MGEALVAKLLPAVAALEVACDGFGGPVAKIDSHPAVRLATPRAWGGAARIGNIRTLRRGLSFAPVPRRQTLDAGRQQFDGTL